MICDLCINKAVINKQVSQAHPTSTALTGTREARLERAACWERLSTVFGCDNGFSNRRRKFSLRFVAKTSTKS